MYMKNYYTQVLNLSSNAILYLFIFASMSLKGLSHIAHSQSHY